MILSGVDDPYPPMPAAPRSALFLDRDGIINHDLGYIYRREDFVFVEGIFELAQAAAAEGLLLVVVTNQAGIGRGFYTEADFHELMTWVRSEFAIRGVSIDRVEFCPDHPTAGIGPYRRDTERRKPGPGMLLDAAAALQLDLGGSIMIGDKASDALAGQRAGVGTTLLVTSDANEAAEAPIGTLVLPTVRAAAAWLRSRTRLP